MRHTPSALLRLMFDGAVAAASPGQLLSAHLPLPPCGRTVVVGAGKAAAAMASAVEQAWANQNDQDALTGLVITRYGHAVRTERIEVVEAAHPVPDQAGLDAARRIRDLVRTLGPDDLMLCLVSGGGSALLTLPAAGITLDEKRAVTRQMLRCGATISEINCVRKHLSAIKGGQLAKSAAPAEVVTLIISDVPGDDPAVIASGPTVADPTTFADARAVLDKYNIEPPPGVGAHLLAAVEETPKLADPSFERSSVRTIVTPQDALDAAATVAEDAGVRPLILSDSVEGESREVALAHAAIARDILRRGQPAEPPCVILSGGETTVTIHGRGRGGPNAEFLLALALALGGEPGVHAIACDTDGIDGTEDNAGAVISPDTLVRGLSRGINARDCLSNNDAYSYFEELGDLVVTGPTRTNVNDFRAVLVEN
ncbi:MAG: glycerate kinase [Alphaproteobacteria bacterium]